MKGKSKSKDKVKVKGSGKRKLKPGLPRPVQSRGFALVGLIALLPIALLLLQGRLDLMAAAQRAVIVLVVLMVLERVGAPLVSAMLHSGHQRVIQTDPDESDEPPTLSP